MSRVNKRLGVKGRKVKNRIKKPDFDYKMGDTYRNHYYRSKKGDVKCWIRYYKNNKDNKGRSFYNIRKYCRNVGLSYEYVRRCISKYGLWENDKIIIKSYDDKQPTNG